MERRQPRGRPHVHPPDHRREAIVVYATDAEITQILKLTTGERKDALLKASLRAYPPPTPVTPRDLEETYPQPRAPSSGVSENR